MISKIKLIILARSYIGTKEESINKNIFSAELDKVGYYKPQKKNGVAWCSQFLDFLAYKLIGDVDKTHEWLYQPTFNDLSASATFQMNYFKKAKRFYSIPKVGDWAFVGNGLTTSHVCLVVAIGATTITTIDGNHNNKVDKVVRGKEKFIGFGRPLYIEENQGVKKFMIELNALEKGSEGTEVATIQTLLKSKGYKGSNKKVLAIDGKFGNNTLFAVKNYQKDNNLDITGKVDSSTWCKLLKG